MGEMLTPETLHTIGTLERDLRQCGWREGMHVIVHSRFREIGGYVCGSTEAMITAMLNILGTEGTLIMPTHSAENSDPRRWRNPPMPESWWQTIRDEMPPFDVRTTPTYKMGILAENFRRWHGARRSDHPQASFTAVGKHAEMLMREHPLADLCGETSPLARLYDLDGHVCLLGIGHSNNTSIHLAEHRAEFPTKKTFEEGVAMRVNGERRWVTYTMIDYDDSDFMLLGADYEEAHPPILGKIGNADVRLMPMRSLVDFAVNWMQTNRHLRANGDEG